MSKVLKMTFTEQNENEPKHSIRFDSAEKGDPLSGIYIKKEALKKAGVKDFSKIKSVDVQLTVHGG